MNLPDVDAIFEQAKVPAIVLWVVKARVTSSQVESQKDGYLLDVLHQEQPKKEFEVEVGHLQLRSHWRE